MQSPSLLDYRANLAMASCANPIDKTAFDPSRGILVGCWQETARPTAVKAFFADSTPATKAVFSP
jgi:hypothetical protein